MHASLAGLSLIATVLSLSFAPAFAQHDLIHARKIHGLHTGDRSSLQKRGPNAELTFYDAGQNACGSVDQDSDYIVALNTAEWDGGSHCYSQITISYGGKTATATITDQCPGCVAGGLDLSRGLFSYFADQGLGTIYGNWEYTGTAPSSSDPPPPPPSPTPTTTWTPPPPPPSSTRVPPSSTWTPPSSTWQPPSSSSSAPPTSSSRAPPSSSASPTDAPLASASSSAAPTSSSSAPPIPSGPVFDEGNLNQFNMALVGLAGVIANAARVQ